MLLQIQNGGERFRRRRYETDGELLGELSIPAARTTDKLPTEARSVGTFPELEAGS